MEVTAALVKDLRERTGAGMMDCKKALIASEGDMDKAIDFLREKGLAQAAKKAGRVAAEGAVVALITEDGKTGVLVEVNCETDFVAKTDNFIKFCNEVAAHIAAAKPADIEAMLAQPYTGNTAITVKDFVAEATVVIGEKLDIRRFTIYESEGLLSSYIHMGGKVGVMLDVTTAAKDNEAAIAFAHDAALQIAAAKPEAVRREEVDPTNLEKEKEVQRVKALESGKPEKIVDRIVEGQIEKYYNEVCLLDQAFVKDPDKNVKTVMAEAAKVAGADIDVKRFVLYVRGEGIEKRQDNFAEEINAMKANLK